MPIPESRLSKWSDHGPQEAAIKTHEAIRNVLDEYQWPSGINYDFYLQGSYHNDTNLYGDSDVDVVMELKSTFRYDSSLLPKWEQDRMSLSIQAPTYDWNDFRRDALKALQSGFGKSLVSQGNKSIKLKGSSRRLAADIVVCMEYRKYSPSYFYAPSYVQGIAFCALRDKHWVTNHPKFHYDNGSEKSKRTGDRYKRTVRMFKSARNCLKTTGQITSKQAPSYFLECLLCNAPDWMYQYKFQDTYRSIANWINQTDLSGLLCQNGQQQLFGESDEQWSVGEAKRLGNSLVYLWNNWD